MAKQNIQTNLLGTQIVISINAKDRFPQYIGHHGEIASVYLDPDGSPKYTIRLNDGNLIDVYSHDFIA